MAKLIVLFLAAQAFMSVLQLRSGRGEDVVLGFRSTARECLHRTVVLRAPRCRTRPQGAFCSKEGQCPARGGKQGTDAHALSGENFWETWSKVTYF